MVEFFANSLVTGFSQSSVMGKGIVLGQLLASTLMLSIILCKWRILARIKMISKRVGRDIMGGRNVLSHYLQRKVNDHTPLENIYWGTCERLVNILPPEVRTLVIGGQPDVAVALSKEDRGLVRSRCDHMLDEGLNYLEYGMGAIAMVVALAPMLGLLGTVWGVLDAFADMGAAGTATIATMAPAISSALVTTVVGLLIAIPGVMAHTALMAQVRELASDAEGFADDLMGRIERDFAAAEGVR